MASVTTEKGTEKKQADDLRSTTGSLMHGLHQGLD